MRFTATLDDLFKTRSHPKVLRALYDLPEGVAATGRDLARRAAVSHPTASQVLDHLAQQGIVQVRKSSVAYRYQLNPRHVAQAELERLFSWERHVRSDLIAFLGEQIRSRVPKGTSAYLFGSVTRTDMTLQSDLDVAVLCPSRSRAGVEEALEEVADHVKVRYGNTVNFVIGSGTLDTLKQSAPGDRRIWERVATEGIRILPADPRSDPAGAR
jgi:predicted nucleotidyltransferase